MRLLLAGFPGSGKRRLAGILSDADGWEPLELRDGGMRAEMPPATGRVVMVTDAPAQDFVPRLTGMPCVYLVRDGRDVTVTEALRRQALSAPDSDLSGIIRDVITAESGPERGDWSQHVNGWIERCDLIVRYEDVVRDPLRVIGRVRELMRLAVEAEPPAIERADQANGRWTGHLSQELAVLFWSRHGAAMERLGYGEREGSIGPSADLDWMTHLKLGQALAERSGRQMRVLIEANKLLDPGNDGVKRYLLLLLKGLLEVQSQGNPDWHFDVLVAGRIAPLADLAGRMDDFAASQKPVPESSQGLLAYERWLLGLRRGLRRGMPGPLYRPLAERYRKGSYRRHLRSLRLFFDDYRPSMIRLRRNLSGYDLVHIPLPNNFGPFRKVTGPFLVTIHDTTHASHPEYHTDDNIAMSEAGMRFLIDRGARALAVSESTRRDAIDRYGLADGQVDTVYSAPDRESIRSVCSSGEAKAVRLAYAIGEGPYLLSLSTIEPRKNLLNVIAAFKQFRLRCPQAEVKLVVAGKAGWKADHIYDSLGLDREDIVFTGYVAEQDLGALYGEALALCYVSHYEGFGLPLIEAMSCGTPVIYGDNSSMPEVAGDAGLGADADDVDAIARCMEQMVLDEPLRRSLGLRAIRRSLRFTRRKMIHETLQAYRRAMGCE